MAITWQQVAAPDMTDVSRMLNIGAGQTAEALKGLSSAFDPIKQAAANSRKDLIEKNTLNAINEINSINDMGQLDSYLKNTGPQQLIDRFGQDNIDLNKVLSTAAGARENLSSRLNNQFQFNENQLKQDETQAFRDINEKINSVKNIKELDSLIPLAQSLKSQFGVDAVKAIDARRSSITADAKAKTLFDQGQKAYKTAQEKEQYAKDKGGWFAGLTRRISQSNLTGGNAIDLEQENLKIQPFYALASPEEQQTLLAEFGKRVMFDPSNPELTPSMKNEVKAAQQKDLELLRPFEQEKTNISANLEKNTKEYNKYALDTKNGAQFDFMSAVSSVTGKDIDGLGIDNNSKFNLDNVREVNNTVNEAVYSLKSEYANSILENPNSTEYAQIQQIAKEKAGNGNPTLTHYQDAANEYIDSFLTDGVILQAIKKSNLGDPWGSGEIKIDEDSFKKAAKIELGRFISSKKAMETLPQQLREADLKLSNKKNELDSESASKLQKMLQGKK